MFFNVKSPQNTYLVAKNKYGFSVLAFYIKFLTKIKSVLIVKRI